MNHLTSSNHEPLSPEELARREQERELYVGLQGSLSAFNGTPGALIFKEVLEREGIAPSDYNPQKQGHYDYYGYLATHGDRLGYHGTEPSPVLVDIFNKIEAEELVGEDVDFKNYRLNHDSPNYHTLTSTGLVRAVVRTKEQDAVVGYFVGISTDGGRQGYAFVGPNDIISVEEQE